MKRICENCKTENEEHDRYCKECGFKLPQISNYEDKGANTNILQQFKQRWDRSANFKVGTLLVFCIVGIIFLSGICALVSTDNLTELNLNNCISDGPGEVHAILDNNTTEYVINGSSESNATVSVSSEDLGIINQTIKLNSENEFSYKVNVPKNVSEIKVRFDASKTGKDDSYIELTLKRSVNESVKQSKTGQYSLNGAYFDIPSGWVEKEKVTDNGIDFWKNGHPHIRLIELSKEEYESDYSASSQSSTNYSVIKKTIKASEIEIKVLRVTDSRNGDILDQYFFQKNDKYYEVLAWDYTYQDASRPTIDEAVKTIATTLN